MEIDKGITFYPGDVTWISYSPGIYMITYSNNVSNRSFNYGLGAWGVYDYGYSGSGVLIEAVSGRLPVVKIGTVLVDSENYTSVTSVDLLSIEKSFYFDSDLQILYVHFENNTSPRDYDSITVGATKGYAKQSGYYDGIYYEGRIKSIPSIVIKKDSTYYGLLSYDKGAISLINEDGAFDNFTNENYYGQLVRILVSDSSDYATFVPVFTGYLDSFSIMNGLTLQLVIRDIRKQLEKKVPYNIFTLTQYPNIDLEYVNKPIPLAYGSCSKVPCTPTDKRESQAVYTFVVADTAKYPIQAITKVYINNTIAAFSGVDLTAGTFNIVSGYLPGQDVTADIIGYNITNPLSIMEDLLSEYFLKPYGDIFFDIAEWSAVRDSGLYSIGLFVSEFTSCTDIINNISQSIYGLFMIDSSGKFTYKIRDTAKTPVATIKHSNIIIGPNVIYNSEEFISSCRIGYDKKYYNDKINSWYLNRDSEIQLVGDYRKSNQRDILTNLVTEADAITYSEKIMTQFGGIFGTYEFTTKTDYSYIAIEDLVDVELYIFDDGTFGTVRLEIIGIGLDYNANRINFTGRWVSAVTANLSAAKLIKWAAQSAIMK